MRGISLITSVIFLAFVIVATGIVYQAGVPSMQRVQCLATVEKMKSAFIELDRITRDVVAEGKGSRRTFDLNVDEGKIFIVGDNDTIYWEYECDTEVFSPRTSQSIGNVVYGSNLDVKAYEGTCEGVDGIIMENQHLIACINSTGSSSQKVNLSTRNLLLSVYQKDLGKWLPMEYLEVTVDEAPSSMTGMGYTYLDESGMHLPYGQATAYIESDYGVTYRINFILESGADFLTIRGE